MRLQVLFHDLMFGNIQSTDTFIQLLDYVWKQAQQQRSPPLPTSAAQQPIPEPDPSPQSSPLHGSTPLHEQYVVKVAAGTDCSLALTGCGEIWTFGLGRNNELATGNYIQMDPQPIAGHIAALVMENGGAIDIAAGERFCLALARNGTVVMWGHSARSGLICNAARGLPGMVKIAAGRQHALLSDGESIWQCKPGFDSPTLLKPQVCYPCCSSECNQITICMCFMARRPRHLQRCPRASGLGPCSLNLKAASDGPIRLRLVCAACHTAHSAGELA
jgi:hypothetical protein